MNNGKVRLSLGLLMSPLLVLACSDSSTEPPVNSGGSLAGGAPAMAGTGTGGVAAAGMSGASVSSSGGTRGGTSGAAGSSGRPQTSAGTGNGGAAGGVSGGTAGGAGTAGRGTAGSAGNGGSASGTGGGGTTGSAGTAGRAGAAASEGGGGTAGSAGSAGTAGSGGASLVSIAADFNPFRLECPCEDANHFGADKQDNCDSTPDVDRQTHVKHLTGDSNVVYNVKLRVRGNTEPNTYVNGKLQGERFYIGGQSSTPGYTAYMLTVSDPKEVYFFNYNPTTGHIHFLIDYEVVIPMKGGATVTFEVNGGNSTPDGHGVSNRDRLVVPGVPPAPDPFNGQFVQFDVLTVEPRPNP